MPPPQRTYRTVHGHIKVDVAVLHRHCHHPALLEAISQRLASPGPRTGLNAQAGVCSSPDTGHFQSRVPRPWVPSKRRSHTDGAKGECTTKTIVRAGRPVTTAATAGASCY